MNLIDEQHVAFFEIGEQTGEVAGFFDGGAAGVFQIRSHRLGNDIRQRGFAEAGRAVEQDVIKRFPAMLGGLHGDFQAFLDAGLAGEIGEKRGSQRHLQRRVSLGQNIRNQTVSHRA